MIEEGLPWKEGPHGKRGETKSKHVDAGEALLLDQKMLSSDLSRAFKKSYALCLFWGLFPLGAYFM